MDRDYRDVRTWDLGSYSLGMDEEIRLNKPEVMHKQYHGDYVLTKDYLEACDEIDRLRAELKELEQYRVRYERLAERLEPPYKRMGMNDLVFKDR